MDNKEEEKELREEILDRGPSRWYQTGFLIPSETNIESKADDTSDDELAGIDGQNLNRSDQAQEQMLLLMILVNLKKVLQEKFFSIFDWS